MLEDLLACPEEVAKRYREEGYWTGEVLGDLLSQAQTGNPDRVALIAADRSITFRELDHWANTIGNGLTSRGLRAGDRILVQLPNIPEFVSVLLAALRFGWVPVLALPSHGRYELDYLCGHTGAVAYVMPGAVGDRDWDALADVVWAGAPSLRHVFAVDPRSRFLNLNATAGGPEATTVRVDPSAVAFLLLSGGTTGTPKLIPRTHRDYACQLRETARTMGTGPESCYLAALPAAHNAALGCPGVLGTLRAGGRVVLAPSPAPDVVFPLIAREHVTLTTVMPSVLKLWSDVSEFVHADLSAVVIEVGGARLDPQVAKIAAASLKAEITHWFGMSEGFLSFTRPGEGIEIAADSCGRPMCHGDELCVVDEAGHPVGPGETGELLVRGPCMIRGYYHEPDYNRQVFTPDGWLMTGDLAHLSAEGRLVIDGRLREVVNRGGEKVPVFELEELLVRHPAVMDAAVLAIPDLHMVEKTCACVVPKDGQTVTLSSLHQHLRELGVATFKLPDVLELLLSLPMTNIGKVDKRRLRELIVAPTSGNVGR